MERFAKRKIKILPARDDLTGQDMVRVFFCGDDKRNFHLADYPRCYSPEVIYENAKKAYLKLKEENTSEGRFKIVKCELKHKESVVDTKGHIKFWKTREEAMSWIEQHSYKGMSFDYVIVKEGK